MPRKIVSKKATAKSTKKPTTRRTNKPAVRTPTAPIAPAPPPPPAPRVSEADKIWAEIRFRPIEMFGLPNQIVEQHVTPFQADPNKLFLTLRSSAVLPSLEAVCGKEFVVEMADKFVIVSRPVVLPTPPRK